MLVHRVRQGDRLSTLASAYGLHADAIIAANPGKPTALLPSGQRVFASLAEGDDIAIPQMLGNAVGHVCSINFDCDGDLVCCGGTCLPSCMTKLPDGSACQKNDDCATGNCVGADPGFFHSYPGFCGVVQTGVPTFPEDPPTATPPAAGPPSAAPPLTNTTTQNVSGSSAGTVAVVVGGIVVVSSAVAGWYFLLRQKR